MSSHMSSTCIAVGSARHRPQTSDWRHPPGVVGRPGIFARAVATLQCRGWVLSGSGDTERQWRH